MRKIKRRLGSIIMIIVLLLSAVPITTFAADHPLGDGAVLDLSTCNAGDTVTIAAGSAVTLTGNRTNIKVSCGAGVSLTLDNVTIINTTAGLSPVIFTGNENTLIIIGSNSLNGSDNRSGDGVAGVTTVGASVLIEGTGTLTATGGRARLGNGGAGIGGGGTQSGGSITISSGTIIAKAGASGGPAYRSGEGICAEKIVIEGGTVTANGHRGGAGIGGSRSIGGSEVTLLGGTITATGNEGTPGIGGCSRSTINPASIAISGGRVIATGGYDSGITAPGIGATHNNLGTGSILLTGGEIFANCLNNNYAPINDIGKGNNSESWDVIIEGTAAVFLQNNKAAGTTTTTHDNEIFSTTDAVYGISLPADWTAPFGTYLSLPTLSYDLNGGSGNVPPSVTQLAGSTVTVGQDSDILRSNCTFIGWNTSADGNGTTYHSDDMLILGNEDVTLYAQWSIETVGVPTIQSVLAGNAQATISWSEVPASASYNIYSSTTSGMYTTPAVIVIGEVYSSEVTGLTNGTPYYLVVTAVGLSGESAYSNEVSTTPRTVPGAPNNVIATASNGQATVSFTPPADNGGSAITGYTVTSSPGNITATGATSPIKVTGLTNGTAYTFTVTAVNAAGTGSVSTASNAVTPYKPSSGGSNSDSTPSTPAIPSQPARGVDILINGKVETAATATTNKEGDKTVTTILVDAKKTEERMEQTGSNAIVTITNISGADTVVAQLNAQTIKSMETKEAVLEIKTGLVTYTLPASQINIDVVSEQIGTQVELKDIVVNVKISESTADAIKIVEDTANKNNYQIVVKPIAFEITCSYGNKTVEVSKFNVYVERRIAIPEGVDPHKITTGIILNDNGTFSHVPTIITVIDGKYYAKINSLTNSIYSVIASPKAFADVENHWAKEAVNDMASRLIISGGTDGLFSPDQDITRAEFASIVIRALGLMRLGTGKDVFNDVAKEDWYYDVSSIAHEYGIISGYGNGKFGPEDTITREQAMSMIARAMKTTKLTVSFESGEEEQLLAAFSDIEQASGWAKSSIAFSVKAEIVSGKNGKRIAPVSNITRAEVAVIIQRLLQKSNLI